MSYYDIDGVREFEDVGEILAESCSPSDWLNMDEQSRESAIRRMARQVQMTFGLRVQPIVVMDLPAGEYGKYDPDTDTVTVAADLVINDEPSEAVGTVTHEVRHALQAAVLNDERRHPQAGRASAVDEAALWREADATYDVDVLDVVTYTYSPLETDARAAGGGALVGYWRRSYELATTGPEDE